MEEKNANDLYQKMQEVMNIVCVQEVIRAYLNKEQLS